MTLPTQKEMLDTLEVLGRLDGSKLLTNDEETALAVVSNALVAITDPFNLHKYPDLDKRLYLRVKIYYDSYE